MISHVNWNYYIFFSTLYIIVIFLFYFQTSTISSIGINIREMWAGDMHTSRAWRCWRWRLLLRLFQRRCCRFQQTGKTLQSIDKKLQSIDTFFYGITKKLQSSFSLNSLKLFYVVKNSQKVIRSKRRPKRQKIKLKIVSFAYQKYLQNH